MDLLHQIHLKTWRSRARAEAHRHRLDLGRGLPALNVMQRPRRCAGPSFLNPPRQANKESSHGDQPVRP